MSKAITPKRWRKLKELISEALELKRSRRYSYLEKACGEDEELLKEARSLLRV